MIITVFGATGQAGKQIVTQALAMGYHVRAFGRDVTRMIDEDLRNQQFEAIQGYVFDKKEVKKAVAGSDAVLSALGGSMDVQDKTRSLGIKNICEQMVDTGVKRIVAIGGRGVLKDDEYEYLLHHPDYPQEYTAVGAEHLQAYLFLKEYGLDYTFYCPPNILDANPDGRYMTRADYPPQPDSYRIFTGNLAMSMLQSVQKNEYVQCRVGICNLV